MSPFGDPRNVVPDQYRIHLSGDVTESVVLAVLRDDQIDLIARRVVEMIESRWPEESSD